MGNVQADAVSPYAIVQGANGAPLRIAPGALSEAVRNGIIPPGAAPTAAPPGLGNANADAAAAGIVPSGAMGTAPGAANVPTPLPGLQTPPVDANGQAPPAANMPQPQQLPDPTRSNAGGITSPGIQSTPGVGTRGLDAVAAQDKRDQSAINADVKRDSDAAKQAVADKTALDMQQADAAYKIQHAYQENQAKLQANVVNAQNTAQQAVDQQQGHITDAANAAAKWSLDPKRFINAMGPASRGLTAVNLILGGFAQGAMMAGGNRGATNPAVDELHRSMDADVEAQKAEYDKLKGNVTNQQNIYANLRQRGMDDVAARQGALIAAGEQAKVQLATNAAKYGSAEAKVRGQQTAAEIDAKNTELKKQMAQTTHANAFAGATARIGVNEFNVDKRLEEQKLGIERQAAEAKAGKRGMIPAAEQEKLDAGIGGITALLDNAEKFHKASSGEPNALAQFRGTSDTAQYQQARHANAGAVAATQEPGAKTQKVFIDRAEESTPNILTTSHSAGMATFRNRFQEARKYMETRVKTAEEMGLDATPYRHQLDQLDRKADQYGLLINGTEVGGGK